MFKSANTEDELFRTMGKTLVDRQVDQDNHISKLIRAIDCLGKAGTIFEKSEMFTEASYIKQVLQGLTDEISHK